MPSTEMSSLIKVISGSHRLQYLLPTSWLSHSHDFGCDLTFSRRLLLPSIQLLFPPNTRRLLCHSWNYDQSVCLILWRIQLHLLNPNWTPLKTHTHDSKHLRVDQTSRLLRMVYMGCQHSNHACEPDLLYWILSDCVSLLLTTNLLRGINTHQSIRQTVPRLLIARPFRHLR